MKKFSFLIILCLIFLVGCSGNQSDKKTSKSIKQNMDAPGAVSEAPSGDAFYQPPESLPVIEPGSVIWSEPLTGLDKSVNGWRVLYVTTGVSGEPVAASALVYAPRDEEKHPLVAWAHGTTGIADTCAPSRTQYKEDLIPFFTDYIDRGYAIVAPDYEGLGTPGTHPFLVGDSEGKSLLDSIRMAQEFSPLNVEGDAVVVGHSQGGHAALFAGELNSSYAKDVKIAGIVAIAPAGDLSFIFPTASQSGDTFGFVVMGAVGFKAAYPDLDLGAVLSADVVAKSSVVEAECLGPILQTYNGDVTQALVGDPRNVAPWPELMQENSPGSRVIGVPLFIEHGLSDLTVPAFISKDIFDKECALGADVARSTYSGEHADHNGVVELGREDTLSFIADRFAGKKFVSTCQ